ncbi:Homeobox_domain-containing protein [Hexamita inflata]|uniref:Homeobox domain-containing protein n=2 Tax=Hexamita inflata TaxID=28002 RepID=A0AA86R119_9EUKA|nr:Homeobox domain-containing protein [Hexamita inflata]
MYQIPIVRTEKNNQSNMFHVTLTSEGVRRLQQLLQDPTCTVLDNQQSSANQKVSATPRFTQIQVNALQSMFIHNPHPTAEMLRDLSCTTGLTESQIRVWFCNHRSRHLHKHASQGSNDSSQVASESSDFAKEQSLVNILAQLVSGRE